MRGLGQCVGQHKALDSLLHISLPGRRSVHLGRIDGIEVVRERGTVEAVQGDAVADLRGVDKCSDGLEDISGLGNGDFPLRVVGCVEEIGERRAIQLV